MLLAVLILPVLGAVGALISRGHQRRAGVIASGFAAAQLIAAALLPINAGNGALWHRVNIPWAHTIGLRFDIGVDGVSYPLIVLSAALTLLCCVHTLIWPPQSGNGVLQALLLVVNVGMCGVFLAANIVLFFVFFEVVLLPMYAIIYRFGGAQRKHAATKFALYTLLGSLLLLAGVFIIVGATGTGDIVLLTQSGGAGMGRGLQILAFSLLGLGFAVKSPLWPLHTWLPDAHTQAPTVGSVILAGVLLKLGTYGFIRVGLPIVPEGAAAAAPVLGCLAVAAIIIGSLVCLAQTELKRLIAYSSVGHMGFVLLGISTMSAVGINAALYGNIAHGLITGLLFFLAGAIKDRSGTGELSQLGGLRDIAPGLSGVLGFAALASLGLPGLAGFWGEAFAIYSALDHGQTLWIVLGVIASFGAALTAAYLLRMVRIVTRGAVATTLTAARAVNKAELAIWTPVGAAIVVFGVAPWLLLNGFATPLLDWVMSP